MPGTIHIDQPETFAAAPIAMSRGRQVKFGTEVQAVNNDGEKKWGVPARRQLQARRADARGRGDQVTITAARTRAGSDPGTPGGVRWSPVRLVRRQRIDSWPGPWRVALFDGRLASGPFGAKSAAAA